MNEKINFRKDYLDKAEAKASRYEIADNKIPGLRLSINSGGSKSYFLYRKIEGRPYRIRIGRYGDLSIENARKEAERLNGLIALGKNPHEEKIAKRKEDTFKEFYERYYDEHAQRFNKTAAFNRTMVYLHAMSELGNLKITSIKRDRIKRIHSTIGMKHPVTANRLIALLSAAFNYAIREGTYTESNPCNGIKKYKQISRDRFLSAKELKLFFAALKSENEYFQDFFSLLIYTGARKSNVMAMRWNDIDLSLQRWRIPESHTKNKDVNIVALSVSACEILTRRMHENTLNGVPTPFVFPGDSKKGHLIDAKKSFSRIRNRMEVYDIRIHDLRRTLGSYMAISGSNLITIGKALNHKSPDSTAIYARLTQDAVLSAVDKAIKTMHYETNV